MSVNINAAIFLFLTLHCTRVVNEFWELQKSRQRLAASTLFEDKQNTVEELSGTRSFVAKYGMFNRSRELADCPRAQSGKFVYCLCNAGLLPAATYQRNRAPCVVCDLLVQALMPSRRIFQSLICLSLLWGCRVFGTSVEVGPLQPDESVEIKADPDGSLPAFRFESFGKGKLVLRLETKRPSSARPYVVVEGPLPNYGDGLAPGAGPIAGRTSVTARGGSAELEIPLIQKGIFRILPGAEEEQVQGKQPDPGTTLILRARCEGDCARPEIGPQEFIEQLSKKDLSTLLGDTEARVAKLVPSRELKEALLNQLHQIEKKTDWNQLSRFPTLPPLSHASQIRPLLGVLFDGIPGKPPEPDRIVHGDLASLLGESKTERGESPLADSEAPNGIHRGYFKDEALTKAQLDQSPALAKILTSLSLNKGSKVSVTDPVTGKTLNAASQDELFRALIASGHKIEMRREVMYSDILPFKAGDRDVKWPVWLDTGVKLPDGSSLKVPIGHSAYTWRISGPVVNARVVFYLGTSGVGFFPDISARPEWTGRATRSVARSWDGGEASIFKAMDVAGRYLRRIRCERGSVAKGLPSDGYGYLGVCNDSVAVIQSALDETSGGKQTLPYPTVRAAELRGGSCSKDDSGRGDGLEDIFARIPHDADVSPKQLADPAYQHEVLCRVLEMTPYSSDSAKMPDEFLRHQLKLVEKMVGGTCGQQGQSVASETKAHAGATNSSH